MPVLWTLQVLWHSRGLPCPTSMLRVHRSHPAVMDRMTAAVQQVCGHSLLPHTVTRVPAEAFWKALSKQAASSVLQVLLRSEFIVYEARNARR